MKWVSFIDELLDKSNTEQKEKDIAKEKGSVFKEYKSADNMPAGINISINGDKNNTNIKIENNATDPSGTNEKHTINCKACGQIVSKAAKTCPHCGQPTGISRLKRHLLLGAMLFAPLVASPTPFFGLIH
jgi:predicted RNA-binding Zn-ribbon protein involved in translation (DUF1610 family)